MIQNLLRAAMAVAAVLTARRLLRSSPPPSRLLATVLNHAPRSAIARPKNPSQSPKVQRQQPQMQC